MKGVLWRRRRRGTEREKLWIGVWMRENEREGEKFMEDDIERVGNNKTSNFFKFQIMRESFTRSI